MEATMAKPAVMGNRSAAAEAIGSVRKSIPAALEASSSKLEADSSSKVKVSKADARRQKSQKLICEIFAVILIAIAILAIACAIYIPLNKGPQFVAKDIWMAMAACCTFFLAALAGKWTICNALL